MNPCDEILDFLVAQIPAQSLADFKASEKTRQRVWELIAREKESGLLPEEKTELDDYMKLEHLVILAKAKASGRRLRDEIRLRAGSRCEYCHTHEAFLLTGCEVDHIVSRKHGGATELANLALSCARCNRAKGTDIGSKHPMTGAFIRLFDPRSDQWNEHFIIAGTHIPGITPIGEVTVNLLHLEHFKKLCSR